MTKEVITADEARSIYEDNITVTDQLLEYDVFRKIKEASIAGKKSMRVECRDSAKNYLSNWDKISVRKSINYLNSIGYVAVECAFSYNIDIYWNNKRRLKNDK